MTGQVAHLMRKDVLEHRTWLAAFIGLAVVRAALVASGVDANVSDQNMLLSLSLAFLLLTIVHGALLVAIAVQLVQGDRLVGTTAFWLTRPVRRADLAAAKLGTAVVVLVVIPVLLDGLAMVASGLSWLDAAGGIAEGAMLRLAVVLPVMALASVTADLAAFVISWIAVVLGTFILESAAQFGRLVPPRSMPSAYSATIVASGVLIAGAAAAFAHQVFTRRRAHVAALACATGLLALIAANWWTKDFVSERGLEAGWLDPGGVTMTVTPEPVDQPKRPAGARLWVVRAALRFTGVGPDVVLTPLDVNSVAVFPDGTTETHRAGTGQPAWTTVPWPPALRRKDLVEALLGGVSLLDAREALDQKPLQPIAAFSDEVYRMYVERGARFDVEATVGVLGYRVGAVLPLDGRGTGAAGDGRFSILSASCGAGKCTVLVREVMPASLLEFGRQSRVAYVLVNRPSRQALLIGERDYFSRVDVFGPAAILAEHVHVKHRRLVFEAPKETPDLIDVGWQKEAAIAALEMRDVGTFRVRAVVAGTGAASWPAQR
jgi:hypothetical protein